MSRHGSSRTAAAAAAITAALLASAAAGVGRPSPTSPTSWSLPRGLAERAFAVGQCPAGFCKSGLPDVCRSGLVRGLGRDPSLGGALPTPSRHQAPLRHAPPPGPSGSLIHGRDPDIDFFLLSGAVLRGRMDPPGQLADPGVGCVPSPRIPDWSAVVSARLGTGNAFVINEKPLPSRPPPRALLMPSSTWCSPLRQTVASRLRERLRRPSAVLNRLGVATPRLRASVPVPGWALVTHTWPTSSSPLRQAVVSRLCEFLLVTTRSVIRRLDASQSRGLIRLCRRLLA